MELLSSSRVDLLKAIVEQEPLFETGPSIDGINPALNTFLKGSIYFGTGLSTPKKPSAGLPFDMLSMTLCAEKIRRSLGLEYIYHHIADTHALSNPFIDRSSLNELTKTTIHTLSLMKKNFHLSNYQIMLSSEFDTTSDYDGILKSIITDKNEYVRRELADVEWYRKYKNVCLKVGWIIQAQETSLKFDERLFDREYLRIVNNGISFVYIKAGQTFDKSRPKASPYIYTEGESRIVLQPDENVADKLSKYDISDRAIFHLQNIVQLFENVVIPLTSNTLQGKIQEIISLLFA